MKFKTILCLLTMICLQCLKTVTNGYGFSLLNGLLGIFEKNSKIRANPQFTIKSADIIMKGINSKRCEDALCLDCVPGFCRERPAPPPTPNIHLSLNRNGTINGFPNITVNSPMIGQLGQIPNSNMTSFNNGMVGVGVQQLASNLSGVVNTQSFQNMGNGLANLFNSNSSSSQTATSTPSPNNSGSFLSSDYSTTNSTGGPPVITTTTPPKMCMCSWI